MSMSMNKSKGDIPGGTFGLNLGRLAAAPFDASDEDVQTKIRSTQASIDAINRRLESASFLGLAESSSSSSSSVVSLADGTSSDWTSIYRFCDRFEDIEELESIRAKEIEKLDEFKFSQEILGHNHDHSVRDKKIKKDKKRERL